MTLSPDDLAAMGERHHARADGLPWCAECEQAWPCDSRRLLDEVEALRHPMLVIDVDDEVFVKRRFSVLRNRVLETLKDFDEVNDGLVKELTRIFEEVMTQTANEPST